MPLQLFTCRTRSSWWKCPIMLRGAHVLQSARFWYGIVQAIKQRLFLAFHTHMVNQSALMCIKQIRGFVCKEIVMPRWCREVKNENLVSSWLKSDFYRKKMTIRLVVFLQWSICLILKFDGCIYMVTCEIIPAFWICYTRTYPQLDRVKWLRPGWICITGLFHSYNLS